MALQHDSKYVGLVLGFMGIDIYEHLVGVKAVLDGS